ncbi:hypothetical protein PVAP13_3NG234026 [Panicum virgatum]|uniref:Uncharacterized protein n=1 Tax=Panicum virgatum TaxID=38727 RepID=A0A8T0UFR8_PANVG|nr:hypothetical protein PVAP13_3NG234026 [Panicum virgatum]
MLARYRALRARTGRTSTPSPSSARRRPSSPGCARARWDKAARRRNVGHGGQAEGAGAAAAGRPRCRGRGRRPAQGREGWRWGRPRRRAGRREEEGDEIGERKRERT